MPGELEKHPEYWEGQEHTFFIRALRQGLDDGPKKYAADTDRRTAWFIDRYHYFPEMMLIGCYAYMEGELGNGWIQRFGGKLKREFYVLRLVRNALVHFAGDLLELRKYKGVNAGVKVHHWPA